MFGRGSEQGLDDSMGAWITVCSKHKWHKLLELSKGRLFWWKSEELRRNFSEGKVAGVFLCCFTSSKVSDQEPCWHQWAAFDAGAFGGLQHQHKLLELSKGRLLWRKAEEL
jgi:hypothetical protein